MNMNPYRACANIAALPRNIREFCRSREYPYDLERIAQYREGIDKPESTESCPIRAVLSEDLPPAIRDGLLSYLNRPPKRRVTTSPEEVGQIVDRLAWPEYRRTLLSILRLHANNGDPLEPAIESLRRHCPRWFK